MMLNKKLLSERDICTKYITPARIRNTPCLFSSNGDGFLFHDRSLAATAVPPRPEPTPLVIADGKPQRHEGSAEGSHDDAPSVPYLAEPTPHVIAEGKPQSHEGSHDETAYMTSQSLSRNIGIAYGNDKSDEYRDVERELSLDEFPSPAELWEKYKRYKGIATTEEERIAAQDYYSAKGGSSRHPRYYQQVDLFDLICHVAYDQPPLTRRERALNVKKRNYFTKYSEQARRVLEALLDKYADEGIENLESLDVLKVRPLTQFGSPIEILREFGGKERFLAAVRELEGEIHRVHGTNVYHLK